MLHCRKACFSKLHRTRTHRKGARILPKQGQTIVQNVATRTAIVFFPPAFGAGGAVVGKARRPLSSGCTWSSHVTPVVVGGGILFSRLALSLCFLCYNSLLASSSRSPSSMFLRFLVTVTPPSKHQWTNSSFPSALALQVHWISGTKLGCGNSTICPPVPKNAGTMTGTCMMLSRQGTTTKRKGERERGGGTGRDKRRGE